MEEKDKVYEEVNNYTKFKLVEMLIEKHLDKKLKSMNAIEQLSDDVLDTLSLCGLKFYGKMKNATKKK